MDPYKACKGCSTWVQMGGFGWYLQSTKKGRNKQGE